MNVFEDYAFWSALLMGFATIVMVFINWNLAKIAKEQFKASKRPYLHIESMTFTDYDTFGVDEMSSLEIKYGNYSKIPTEMLGIKLIINTYKETKYKKNITLYEEVGAMRFENFPTCKWDGKFEIIIYYRGIFDRTCYETVKKGAYIRYSDSQPELFHYDNNSNEVRHPEGRLLHVRE